MGLEEAIAPPNSDNSPLLSTYLSQSGEFSSNVVPKNINSLSNVTVGEF